MTSRFTVMPTGLAGLVVIERKPISDTRGYLERLFCSHDLAQAGVDWLPVQVNRTLTRQPGTVRGLHFQRPPHAEDKLVSCLKGKIFDVAVDLRSSSPTFLQWHGQELSEDNNLSLLIPKGFAHGFQTLTEDCELLYLHSAMYEPTAESGINHADERLDISWPLPVGDISDRDSRLPATTDGFEGLSA